VQPGAKVVATGAPDSPVASRSGPRSVLAGSGAGGADVGNVGDYGGKEERKGCAGHKDGGPYPHPVAEAEGVIGYGQTLVEGRFSAGSPLLGHLLDR
jgi:hypothetical protein